MSPNPPNRTTHSSNEEAYCDEPAFPEHPFVIGGKYSRSDIYEILEIPTDKQGADWNNGYHREANDYFIFCNIETSGRTGHNYSNYWRGDTLVWSGKTNSHFEQESIKKLLSSDYRKFIFYRKTNREPFIFAGVGIPSPHLRSTKPIKIDWSFISSPFQQSTAYTPNIDPRAIEMNLSDVGKRKPLSPAKEPKQAAGNIFTRLFDKFLTKPPSSQVTQEGTPEANKPATQSEHTAEQKTTKEEIPLTRNVAVPPDFVAQLMAGSAQWEPFDHKQMIDITDDSALCSYYEKLQCNNVSEFLALSEKRFDIRGYWEPCEEMLQFILRSHFPTEAPSLKQTQGVEDNSDSLSIHSQLEASPLASIAQTAPSHDEIEDFVDELMAGRTAWQPLDQIEMKDLSSNNGLLYYYELSQCTNLGEFITLADKRFKIRGYWEGSEKRLKEELTKFFESQVPQDIHQDTPSQCEEDSTAGYGQNLEDPTLPFQNTTEQLNARPPNTKETLSESPLAEREGEDLIQQEQRHRDLTTHLMYGSTQWDGFDRMSISDITHHSALCKFYKRVNARNLSEFLALGRTRMSYQGYGKSTEQKLRALLLHFFKTNSTPSTSIASLTEQENPSTNASQSAEFIKQSEAAKDSRANSTLASVEKSTKATQNSSERTEVIAPCPVIIPESESAVLTDIVKGPPEACAPLIEADVHVAPKYDSKPKYTSNASVQQLTRELLLGDAHVAALDSHWIGDISNDVRLANVYDYSKATNVSEFLALGKKRMEIRNYGKLSERKLKEAILAFLTNHADTREKATIVDEGTSPFSLNKIDVSLDSILNSKRPDMLINESTWNRWAQLLVESKLANESIYYACLEIGERWPIRNGWQNKTVEDFRSSSLKELLSTKNFGKIKLRSLIKATAYILSDRRKVILNKSPEERLDWLKNTIPLEEREQEIFDRRFNGDTLDGIGNKLNLSRERIRQIQKIILFKYRSPLGLQICSEFLDQKQQSIWHSVAKGKLHLPKSTALDIDDLELTNQECFALFVYTGEKVKGERFSAIVAEFFNRRYQQTANHWIDLPYDAFDISAAISLAQSAINRTSTPIAFKELANRLPHIDQGLLRISIQLSESINSFYGYLVPGRLTPRKRRAIGAHVTLNKLEKTDKIVSTPTLLRAYLHAFGSDNCNERDIEMVMTDYSHLFFKIGQEGWISTGTPGMAESKLLIANAELEEDEPETELNEASLKNQQIAEALIKTGIAHVTAIQKQLNDDGVHIPMTSIQPMLHSSELFVRFAPGFYGLKAQIQDQDAIKQARTNIIDSPINPRIPILQLRSYVFSRYAGEPKDVHLLWGNEMEKLWAENLFEQEDDDLAKSFWFLLSPNDISKDPEIIERYKKRRANCQYKLNGNMPNINAAKRVNFDDILSSLVYLKQAGHISCARSNMLMGRRIDGLHSISLLATLVLLGAIQPEDDWRKAHYLKGSIDELIQDLKDAYSRNPDINWETGLSKLLLPTIDSNMNLQLNGWMKKINVDQLRVHFHPLEAVKPKQSVDLSVSATRSPNGGIQI